MMNQLKKYKLPLLISLMIIIFLQPLCEGKFALCGKLLLGGLAGMGLGWIWTSIEKYYKL